MMLNKLIKLWCVALNEGSNGNKYKAAVMFVFPHNVHYVITFYISKAK